MLILANVAFVGSHFLMSHPLRSMMVRLLGPGGFTLIYSVISLLLFYWVIVEFGSAPKEAGLWPDNDLFWGLASLATLVASLLFVGSLFRNPSLPGASEKLAEQKPFGVYKITRHPMMWGFALWGTAHILIAPRIDNFIFCGSIVFLALAGAKAQEAKKAKMIGVAWDSWLRQTTFGLRLTALRGIDTTSWIAALTFWGIMQWSHQFLGVNGAGIFRWVAF
ncbi:MAG: NnrU family protein [Sphingorhabdus sp.]